MRYLSWPNLVSSLRVPLAAAFVAVDGQAAKGAILAVGACSDFLDGWLARRLGQRTRLGEVLDPLADKAFLVTVLASFALTGRLAPWQLAALLLRDAYTAAAFLTALALRLPVRFRARLAGKVVTGIQILAALALLFRWPAIGPLALAAGAAGAYAAVDYTRAAVRGLRGGRAGP